LSFFFTIIYTPSRPLPLRSFAGVWNLCKGQEVQPGRLWIHSAAKVMEEEERIRIEEMYTELFALDDVQPSFPKHYPKSSLLGCIDLVKVVSQDHFQSLPLRDSVKGESSSPYVFLCTNPQRLILPLSCISGDHKIWSISKKTYLSANDQGLINIPNHNNANFEQALRSFNNNNNNNGETKTNTVTNNNNKSILFLNIIRRYH
jgi:hypothetical protein